MPKPFNHFYDFGVFRLDVANQLLLRAGVRVALMPKTFELLLVLVEQAGQVVEKEELMQRVWSDVVVEENNLNKHISNLRKVFGESGSEACYIETLPRRGYRFVAEIRKIQETEKANDFIVVPPPHDDALVSESQNIAEMPQRTPQLQPVPPERASRRRALISKKGGWVGLSALLLITTAILAGQLLYARLERPETEAITSIAVLPLQTLPADEEGTRLGLGIADSLISRLDRLNQFVVRPVRAVASYADARQDPVKIGEQLQVDAVLDGSLQHSGNHLRVTLRLLRVNTGKTLWTETFDGQQASTFALQDELADKMAARLALKLGRDLPARPASLSTPDEEVRKAYLRGRYLWNRRTPGSVDKAIEYFKVAVEKDPRYAPAWAGLAEAYVISSSYGHEEKVRLAKDAGRRALALDETLAPVHTALAFLAENFEHDWEQAERSYKRAIELNPNYATAHHWYAECLAFMGRFDEALVEIKRALEIEPFSLAINKDMALIYAHAGERRRAIELFKKTLELDPNFTPVYDLIAGSCEVEGRYDEAVEYYLKARTLKGVEADQVAALRAAYAESGWQGFWQRELNWIQAAPETRSPGPYLLAQIHLRLGDRERAIKSLQQAFAERHLMSALKVDAIFKPLHDDPRFANLLRRVGLS